MPVSQPVSSYVKEAATNDANIQAGFCVVPARVASLDSMVLHCRFFLQQAEATAVRS